MLLHVDLDWNFITKVLLLLIIAAFAIYNFIGSKRGSDIDNDAMNDSASPEAMD